MELSDPAGPSSSPTDNDGTSRRRSGRVKQQAMRNQSDPDTPQNGSVGQKRKRVTPSNHDADGQDSAVEEDISPDEGESDPDEEELKERRQKAFKARKSAARPASKKSKLTAPKIMNLPERPAKKGSKKRAKTKKKKSRARPSAVVSDEDSGLYGR